MRNLLLLAVVLLSGCARNPTSPLAPLQQDESIVFPESIGPAPIVGRPGKPYALEGATLQALTIATNDFLPSGSNETPCWGRRDAYVYQVLRQGDVIFIEIHGDPAACEGQFLMLDSGIRYAISIDGRILRRLQTGEPEWPARALTATSDAGMSDGMRELDVSVIVEVPQGSSPPVEPLKRLDAGTGGSVSPSSAAVDGGTPFDGGALMLPR